MKKQLPKPNIIERAIATISPSWALERHKNRAAMALTSGIGYTGAGWNDRMAHYNPNVGDADADTLLDLRMLRARSRELVRNNPIAGGAIETQVTNVIGSGLKLQSRIDYEKLGVSEDEAEKWQTSTERLFRLWASSEMCDASGTQTFYEIQDLALRSALESGDNLTVLANRKRDNWPFKLALQLVEADRICNKDFEQDTDKCTGGIERDDNFFPVAAWVCNRHPGRYISPTSFKWQRVEFRGQKSGRRNAIHLFRKIRPGQTRGVPSLAPIIETLKQLGRYSEAELDAAVTNASLALFVKMDPEAFEDVFTADAKKQIINSAMEWDGALRPNKAVNLLPGEEIESANTNRPNPNFDPFVSAFMRQVGMGLNIPVEVLTKHFQSSYSAARAALLDAWRTFKIRREWMASRWCQPIYEEWLADAVANGLIQAPGFFADPIVRAAWCGSTWSGDGPGAIDPEKEANAAAKRIETGITTLPEEIIAYDGGDWESKHREQSHVQSEREAAGLAPPVNMPKPGAAAPMQSSPTSKPKDLDARGMRRALAIRAEIKE